MCDANKWFERMRENIEHAQRDFESGNFNGVDYFLGRLRGDILIVSRMYGRKPCESDKSSDGSTMWEHLH